MKKLSFIMAIIMIVMTFPMMFMTSASATEATTSPVTDADIATGKQCMIVTPAAVEGEDDVKTYYDTIPDALAAVADGGTIYVLKTLDHGSSTIHWMLKGKDVTIDFNGNTWTGSAGVRMANLNYNEGTTANYIPADKAAEMASELIVKNAKIECKGAATIFQVYNYMTATFEDCVMTFESKKDHYGTSIMQSYTTLKLIRCDVRVLDTLGGASGYKGNTNGMFFRDNGSVGNTFIVEDSYLYTPGVLMKSISTGDTKGPLTFDFKNSTIETGHQNMFVLQTSDVTIKADNCNFNIYKDGRNGDEGDLGAFIWQHGGTNRVTVDVKNSNIVANDMKSSQYVVGKDSAAAKTLGNSYTFTNTNITANGGNLFDLAGDVDVVVDGGTYITDGRLFYSHNAKDAVKQARITIKGGQFIARNHTKDIDDFDGLTPLSGAIMASNGASFDIYGGTFALYQDSNSVLNTTAPIIFCWGGAANLVKVYGGTFIGGCGMMARVTSTGNENAPYAPENAKIYAYEEGKTSVEIAPSVKKGASVRLDTKSGLRFSSDINAWTVNYVATELAKEGTAVEYGTMITRSSYLKYTSGEFTMAAFDAKGMTSRYINVVAKDGIVKNADGSVTIHAALVDIDADNYQKDFVAISYIKYTNANDEVAYIYAGNVSLAENSRNIEEVALAALADVQTKAGGAYTNAVSEYYVYNMAARKYELVKSTAYSAYTADQIKALQSYIVVED